MIKSVGKNHYPEYMMMMAAEHSSKLHVSGTRWCASRGSGYWLVKLLLIIFENSWWLGKTNIFVLQEKQEGGSGKLQTCYRVNPPGRYFHAWERLKGDQEQ